MAIGLIGAAVGAVGQLAAAQAEAQNNKYNAAVERVNERSKRREGLAEGVKIGEQYNRVEGTQQAGMAAGGVDPFFGSAMDVFEETRGDRKWDQSANWVNAESKATAHENKAAQYDMNAEAAQKAGVIGALGTFLGGLKGISSSFGSSMGSGGGGWSQTY